MDQQARLLDKEIKAGQILVLHIERPAAFDFAAGQFCLVTVPDMGFHDSGGLRRALSMASSPLERDLLFTARVTDTAFKRTLWELPTGSSVDMQGPMGMFTLPIDSATPLVFLAGGVGVAPLRSMLRYAADAGTGHRISLFYSSRVPEEALFLDEFEEIAAKHVGITVFATITRPEQSATKWTGPTGRLSGRTIKERCSEWARATYYVSGPPVMVEAMKLLLAEMEIDQGHIKQEVWTGY
jgi:ferredoxin-NADP reductase